MADLRRLSRTFSPTCARGNGQGAYTAFQGRNAAFQYILRGVGETAVDIARVGQAKVQDIPEVAECYNISGEFDYLLKIYAPDMQYYNEFCINVLGTIKSLGSIQSSFVMNPVKTSVGIPMRGL